MRYSQGIHCSPFSFLKPFLQLHFRFYSPHSNTECEIVQPVLLYPLSV
jgi:hypothetical protein